MISGLVFCGYRYHWSQENLTRSDELNKTVNKENFQHIILKKIPKEWENFEVIQEKRWKLIIGN